MIVNIIYFFEDINSLGHCWEGDWIRELFTSDIVKNIEYNINRYDQINNYDNPILIINDPTYKDAINFIETELKDRKFMLFNISDETLRFNINIMNLF